MSTKIQTVKNRINAPLVFISSFLILILLGGLILLLPGIATESISVIDAFFTATSAICITGLAVVDTQFDFTATGQWAIIALVQVGGLGILTFTSFFAFFFRGDSYSFQAQMVLTDVTKDSRLGNVRRVLSQIVWVTLAIEAVGAVLIYQSIQGVESLNNWTEASRFAIFHSISAFCNAGFSTFSDGLYDEGVRYHYQLHWIIAILFILGGLGFPIALNILRLLRYYLVRIWQRLWDGKRPNVRPHIVTMNSQIVLWTTAILLIGGTLVIWLLEHGQWSATQHPLEQFSIAFFTAATPRTAGFNIVDMSALRTPTLLIIILLMWIGASPGSTGGGVKTSTVAIALLNAFSLSRNKRSLEINYRNIHQDTIRRALAVIILSVMVIFTSTFLLLLTDPEIAPFALFFESVSAFSTVGLSLGITSELSTASKVVLIFTMFIGRVGMFSLLASFLKKGIHPAYAYPEEKILIN